MLTLEEQIDRIAGAAFDETVAVRWRAPIGASETDESPRSRRRAWSIAVAAAMVVMLVGGLIAVVRDDSAPTSPPAATPRPTPVSVSTVEQTITESPPDSTDPVVTSVQTPPQPLVLGEGSPLVAITTNGDAVVYDIDARPVVLLDASDPAVSSPGEAEANSAEHLTINSDGSIAYVGLCCASSTGQIVPVGTSAGKATSSPGRTPMLNPAASHLAYIVDASVAAHDLLTGRVSTTDVRVGSQQLPLEAIEDLMWLGDRQFLVLGRIANSWTRTVVDVTDEGLRAQTTYPVASTREFPRLQFAGQARQGEIAVHEVGTDRVLSAPLEKYGNNNGGRGSALSVLELPEPALSAWYVTPEHLVWIDTSNALHDGALTVEGKFVWARR
jgi:hypothetical protein